MMDVGDQPARTPRHRTAMHTELFGVFGGRDTLERLRDTAAFDAILEGEAVTVGVRDENLGLEGRTQLASDPNGVCAIWGEAYLGGDGRETADRLLAAYNRRGRESLDGLNGSYVTVLEMDGRPTVVVDPIRSWECFHTVQDGTRLFGTDLSGVVGGVADPDVDPRAVQEFLHLGTVLGDRTLLEAVQRIPFDGMLTPDGPETLDRFVYAPREGDHARDLSRRLNRAIRRRAEYPGRKGLLLSAGQDSRSILASVPSVERCYTVGWPDAQEVSVAAKLSGQYGATHDVLVPDGRYLEPSDRKVRYSQGLRESLHAHQAGYEPALDIDVVYHGLLFDTLLKGYFLERAGVELFGQKIPLGGIDRTVDPIDSLLETLGYMPGASGELADCAGRFLEAVVPTVNIADDGEAALRESFTAELRRGQHRVDSVPNAMDLLVIRNQPALSFRTHLADTFLETFVAVDRDLLQWHLHTPPAHRNPRTVRSAIEELDAGAFRHPTPGHRHTSPTLNRVERVVRRRLPFIQTVEPAWPDRQTIYEQYELDERLFPAYPAVHELPPRIKLRLNDLRWWLSAIRGDSTAR